MLPRAVTRVGLLATFDSPTTLLHFSSPFSPSPPLCFTLFHLGFFLFNPSSPIVSIVLLYFPFYSPIAASFSFQRKDYIWKTTDKFDHSNVSKEQISFSVEHIDNAVLTWFPEVHSLCWSLIIYAQWYLLCNIGAADHRLDSGQMVGTDVAEHRRMARSIRTLGPRLVT